MNRRKFAGYMVKAISLLFDLKSEEEKVELVQPLETLTKMGKANLILEDESETNEIKQINWPQIDCTLC